MNEFKFNCPTCGQHILAAHEWIGRQIECPSCEKSITVQPPAKAPKKTTPVMPATPKPHPESAEDSLRVATKTNVAKKPAAQTPTAPPAAKFSPGDKTKVAQTSPTSPSAKVSGHGKPGDAGSDPIATPSPKNAPKKSSLAVPAPLKPSPKPKGEVIQTKSPGDDSIVDDVQPPKEAASAKISGTDEPEVAGSEPKTKSATVPDQELERLRVAALTPAIKLDMVRAVRQRIADESSWLPGRVKDENAYAAKVSQGETIIEDVSSPEATRFSLIGAFLLEFRLRNVARTATGRTNLLDEEIPDAMREVLLDGMNEAEREQGNDPLANKSRKPLSHAQCLTVLDVLEERYSQKIEHVRVEKSKRSLAEVRLPDLVKKLESKARVTPEDVATALYHELLDVRRRLDRLESQATPDK